MTGLPNRRAVVHRSQELQYLRTRGGAERGTDRDSAMIGQQGGVGVANGRAHLRGQVAGAVRGVRHHRNLVHGQRGNLVMHRRNGQPRMAKVVA